MNKMTEEELEMYAMGEDAPQIVGVIDDRPPELVAKEDYTKSIKWKGLASVSDEPISAKLADRKRSKTSKSPDKKSDLSPPRRGKGSHDISPPRRRHKNPDQSPPRRKMASSPDLSPRRKSDLSPPRRRHRSPDLSPPRQRQSDKSPSSSTSNRHRRSPDMSPPRHRRDHSGDNHLAKGHRSQKSPDLSPVRRKPRSPDTSPPRRQRNYSPGRPKSHYGGASSSRFASKRKVSESPPPTHRPRKMPAASESNSDSESEATAKSSKTLDGKTAGLQDAKQLRIESDKHRKREDELFRKMEADVSGRNAEVVVRDRRTGRIRDLEMESAKEREKQKKLAERQLVYDRWGKG